MRVSLTRSLSGMSRAPRCVPRLAVSIRVGDPLRLTAVGYVPIPSLLIGLGWLAAASQLTAVSFGRYAPYPIARERPPRGPIREVVRRLLLLALGPRRRQAALKRASGS